MTEEWEDFVAALELLSDEDIISTATTIVSETMTPRSISLNSYELRRIAREKWLELFTSDLTKQMNYALDQIHRSYYIYNEISAEDPLTPNHAEELGLWYEMVTSALFAFRDRHTDYVAALAIKDRILGAIAE